jgi:hypothetical protein
MTDPIISTIKWTNDAAREYFDFLQRTIAEEYRDGMKHAGKMSPEQMHDEKLKLDRRCSVMREEAISIYTRFTTPVVIVQKEDIANDR